MSLREVLRLDKRITSANMQSILFALLLLRPSSGAQVNRICSSSHPAEPDIRIHGRLATYNGGYPNLRLWHVGTRHLYGIYSGTEDQIGQGDREEKGPTLPGNLEAIYDEAREPFEVVIFGDFVIRPLKRRIEGRMQPACIVAAEHLVRQAEK